eukprot:g924.t1
MAWKELCDKKSGKMYYYDSETKKTTWEKPAHYTPLLTGAAPKDTDKDDLSRVGKATEFWERLDPATNRMYYINSQTKKTSWKLPAGGVVVEKKKRKKKKRTTKAQSTVSSSLNMTSTPPKPTVNVSNTGSVQITTTVPEFNASSYNEIKSSPKTLAAVDQLLAKYGNTPPLAPSDTSTGPEKPQVYVSRGGSVEVTRPNGSSTHVDRFGNVATQGAGGSGFGKVSNVSESDANNRADREEAIINNFQPLSPKEQRQYSEEHFLSRIQAPSLGSRFSETRSVLDTTGALKKYTVSPYNSILVETKSLREESSRLETTCTRINESLSNFRSGVKSTLGQVEELLSELDQIEKRAPVRRGETSFAGGGIKKSMSRKDSITVTGAGGYDIDVKAQVNDPQAQDFLTRRASYHRGGGMIGAKLDEKVLEREIADEPNEKQTASSKSNNPFLQPSKMSASLKPMNTRRGSALSKTFDNLMRDGATDFTATGGTLRRGSIRLIE